MICLYNIDTVFKTAENVVENKLMTFIIASIIEDAISNPS
jgi:hypothetical protein